MKVYQHKSNIQKYNKILKQMYMKTMGRMGRMRPKRPVGPLHTGVSGASPVPSKLSFDSFAQFLHQIRRNGSGPDYKGPAVWGPENKLKNRAILISSRVTVACVLRLLMRVPAGWARK